MDNLRICSEEHDLLLRKSGVSLVEHSELDLIVLLLCLVEGYPAGSKFGLLEREDFSDFSLNALLDNWRLRVCAGIDAGRAEKLMLLLLHVGDEAEF